MFSIVAWVAQHTFDLVSAAGIIAGLGFTAASFREDTRSRRLANLIKLTQQHRDIWEETQSNPRLVRVIDSKADLYTKPISVEESQFVVLVILHLHCWYRAIQEGEVESLDGLSKDVREFFALPIPGRVWNEKKEFQDRDFVQFVESVRKL